MGLQPFQQRTRDVKHGGEEVVSREPLQDRPIDVLDVLSEDMIEVADGLMQMETKHESDGIHLLAEDE
jgi:hypothetical protein